MLDSAALGARARSAAVIEILDALHDAKSDAATGEEGDRFGAAVGESAHAFLGMLPAAEELHVLEDVVEVGGIAGLGFQVISRDPDQPVRIGGTAAQPIRLFADDCAQA